MHKLIRTVIILFFLLMSAVAVANMGNPVHDGTLGARPFISQYVDIVQEDLFITIDKHFQTAHIKAVYRVRTRKEGVQIPLLFYASDYLDSFMVSVDGKGMATQVVPERYKKIKGTAFRDFDYVFDDSLNDEYYTVIWTGSTTGSHVKISDMKYFETDFTPGEHIIVASYRASLWEDGWDWIKEYSFRYALSPALSWKSFSNINVTIDADNCDKEYTTNLGAPAAGTHQKTATWHFDKLPVETIQIVHIPRVNPVARLLLFFRPLGLTVIFGLFILLLMRKQVKVYRNQHPQKRISAPLIWGTFVLPVIIFFFWELSIKGIKWLIGEHAGMGIDPYSRIFIPVLLYIPVALLVGIILWNIDAHVKNQQNPCNN